jgi:putative transposase
MKTNVWFCKFQPVEIRGDRFRLKGTIVGSYTSLTYHIVFGTKHRQPTIRRDVRDRLFEYVGGAVRGLKGRSIAVGGVEDHIHLLANLSPTIAISDVIREIKAGSSKWMNVLSETKSRFEWQKGYAAFTVSYSNIDSVELYVKRQEQHHTRKTFREEYIEFLRRHKIEFEDAHLFEGEFHG